MSLETIYSYLFPVVIVGVGLLAFLYSRLLSKINTLTSGNTKKDILTTLNQFLKKTNSNKKEIESLQKQFEQHFNFSKGHFQKIGFKRFNPFTDTGGDQSFILSLLDAHDNGFVISSLHSRENTRIYAKNISAGKSTDQVLSKEEKQVVQKAIKYTSLK